MYPVLFKIGQFSFYTHGLMAVLGIIVTSLLVYLLSRREHLGNSLLFDNMVYTVLFGIIGARITYYLLYADQFAATKEIFYLWQGGLVSFGGFIIGGLTLFLLLKFQKEPVWKWFDLFAIAFPLGLFLGRIGDLLAGEYAGIPSSSKLSINGVLPVTGYEALFCFLLFFVFLSVYLKNNKKNFTGRYFSSLLVIYPLGRFFIDFYRDEKDVIWVLSTGQVTSLALIVIGLSFLAKTVKGRKNVK